MRSKEITLEDKPPKALPIYETPMARPQALLSLHIYSPWKAFHGGKSPMEGLELLSLFCDDQSKKGILGARFWWCTR